MSELQQAGSIDAARQAFDDLVELSTLRAEAHDYANLFDDRLMSPEQAARHEVRAELSRAETLVARWAIVTSQSEIRSVDLARLMMGGDWDATQNAEDDLAGLAAQEGQGVIERRSNESKLRILIDPTLLGINGLLAVRRKRRVMTTQTTDTSFRDRRSGTAVTARTHIDVDKVSEFVFDPQALASDDSRVDAAAAEIEAIIEADRPFEITAEPANKTLVGVIEDAIDTRHHALVPAVTTYYAHRKHNIARVRRPVSEADREALRKVQQMAAFLQFAADLEKVRRGGSVRA